VDLPEKYQELQKFLNGAKESIRLIDVEINRLENTMDAPKLAPAGAPPEVSKGVKIMSLEKQKNYWHDAVWSESEKSVKGADPKEASQVLKTVRDDFFPNENNSKGADEIKKHGKGEKDLEDSQDYMDYLRNYNQATHSNNNKTSGPTARKGSPGDLNQPKIEGKPAKELSPGEQYAQSLSYSQNFEQSKDVGKEIGNEKLKSQNLDSNSQPYSPGLEYSLSLSYSGDIENGTTIEPDKETIDKEDKDDGLDKP